MKTDFLAAYSDHRGAGFPGDAGRLAGAIFLMARSSAASVSLAPILRAVSMNRSNCGFSSDAGGLRAGMSGSLGGITRFRTAALAAAWQLPCGQMRDASGSPPPSRQRSPCVRCGQGRPSSSANELAGAGWLRPDKGRRHTSSGVSGKGARGCRERCSRRSGSDGLPASTSRSVGRTPHSTERGRQHPIHVAPRLGFGPALSAAGRSGQCQSCSSHRIPYRSNSNCRGSAMSDPSHRSGPALRRPILHRPCSNSRSVGQPLADNAPQRTVGVIHLGHGMSSIISPHVTHNTLAIAWVCQHFRDQVARHVKASPWVRGGVSTTDLPAQAESAPQHSSQNGPAPVSSSRSSSSEQRPVGWAQVQQSCRVPG